MDLLRDDTSTVAYGRVTRDDNKLNQNISNKMVRRRFMSKGNATFVDGLDKTVLKQCAKEHPLFRRTAILSSVLNDVLDQERDFLQPCSRKMKKKERRRRAKPIDRTNISAEELEYQRLLNEIKEAEEYELIVERDNSKLYKDHINLSEMTKFAANKFSGNYSKPSEFEKTCSKLVEENDMTKENSDKRKHSVGLSLNKNEDINQLEVTGSPLIFIVHPSEPTTSTPLHVFRSTHTPHPHQNMLNFDGGVQLSPIILDREDIVCDIIEREAPATRLRSDGNEVEGKSGAETNGCNRFTSVTGISTTLQKSSPQLTILNSPGRWGFQNEEYVCEDVTSSVQGDKSLSLCDGNGENRPFYLNGFPWTAQYAKKRDYKQELFHLCMQKSIQSWRLKKTLLDLSSPIKLGEGTFGEVFRVSYKGEIVALKVIPVGGTKMINGDKQKSFRDISAELIVSKELSDLKYIEEGYSTQGFIHLRGAMVVKGVLNL
uniref:Protein kinase domain-containing protein n=1 Tax=Wuchereria bancrofti TaxID=6293 RepID=A0A1I8EUU0_WUCBA